MKDNGWVLLFCLLFVISFSLNVFLIYEMDNLYSNQYDLEDKLDHVMRYCGS